MKRYHVHAGDRYYPFKAMGNFKASFATLVEAQEFEKLISKDYDWIEIVDIMQYC